MDIKISRVTAADKEILAEIRIVSMRESLQAVGRFDPERARSRFIDTFDVQGTQAISIENQLAGFFTLKEYDDHLYLQHFYIHPKFQSRGLGSKILSKGLASMLFK